MPLISDADVAQIRTFFEANLDGPVRIDLYTEKPSLLVVPGQAHCEYCAETEQLVEEIAAISEKIAVDVHDLRADPSAGELAGIRRDMVPAIVLGGANRGTVRYFGVPAGYEFASLLQDLVEISTGTTSLHDSTRQQLAALESDVQIRVFVTPT